MVPANPVVAELWRGDGVESLHRGAWVLATTDGRIVDGRGDPHQAVYARSSTKSLQALPLVELLGTELSLEEIAVAIASHNGEDVHVEATERLLARAGVGPDALACGPQAPAHDRNLDGTALTNNCSGKHAGFLAATAALGADPQTYLSIDGPVQQRVHQAILELTRADPTTVATAIDGCSAPTYRLPLAALATGLARVANPGDLPPHRAAACCQILDAARAHPRLVGGTSTPRFDTDVLQVSRGRLFAKGGAEAVQTIGVVGAGVAIAAKIDDGGTRSLHRLALGVLRRHQLIGAAELDALAAWHDPVRRNRAGLVIGRHVLADGIV